MRPDQSPLATQRNALNGELGFGTSSKVKDEGRHSSARKKRTPVISAVEINSYHFNVLSTVSSVTVVKFVAKKVVTKLTRMPTEVIIIGK